MVLMSGRGGIFAPEVAQNINIIPILFHDHEKVRRAYQHLSAVPNGPEIDLYRRYNDLVLAVAASLHFKDLSPADMDLGFYPSPTTEPAPLRTVTNTQPSSAASAATSLSRKPPAS